MRQFLLYFGINPTKYEDVIGMNIALLKHIDKIIERNPDVLTVWDLADILWQYFVEHISIEDENVESEIDDAEEYRHEELFLEDKLIDDIEYLIRNKKNVILQGPPGVGKTFSVKKILRDRFDIFDANEQILTVQFHQSYSYEEFVEGLRPTSQGTGFVVESGVIKTFIEEKIIPHPDKKFFLIIDEINRGNLSKIFGELLLLIENDKRGETHKVKLPYSNDDFYVPNNLHIIGTMNTADRSLALIDYALRRRFSFVDLRAMYGSYKFNKHLYNIGLTDAQVKRVNDTMMNINKEIEKDLGSHFKIGHSYFVANHVDDFDQWYNNVIKFDIIPLLKEYYFDDEEKIRKFLLDLDLF